MFLLYIIGSVMLVSPKKVLKSFSVVQATRHN